MALQRVESDAIQDDAITTAKIAPNAVAAADIAPNAITNIKVSAGAAIDISKIAGLGTAADKTVGTAANNVVQLDGSGNLPAVNASAVTNLTSGNLVGALPAISGANLTGVSTDTSAIENNIAILAFKTQAANDLAKFNLVDQVIDEYKDGTGATYTTAGQGGSTAADGYLASIYSSVGAFTSDANTQALLHMDDTGLSDSSSNSHATTLVGNTVRSSTQYKYGSYSSYFDGTGDVLKLPIDTDFVFSTGAWTIEGWFYPTSLSATRSWYTASSSNTAGWNNPSGTGAFALKFATNGAVIIDTEEVAAHTGSAGAVSINTWAHIAITHASGSSDIKVWKDGSLQSTIGVGASRSYGMTGGQPGIGVYDFYSSNYRQPYQGYIEEFRISTVERYTTTFTPNTTSATSATGTATSTANTALTAPTTGDIVLLIENESGTATLNTAGNDLRCAISRNGGTGWDYVTLVDKGSWGTNKKILVANNVAFSNSASGTDMRYKLEWANQAAGSKVIRVHATSLAWA